MTNLMQLRRRGAARLRKQFDRPLFPARQGIGVLPWLAGPGMHTRYFLNAMRDPLLDDSETDIRITRFDEGGAVMAETDHRLGHARITVVDLPEADRLRCGYSWATNPARRQKTIALEFHVQLMAEHSFAKTHGRNKGIPLFGGLNSIDRAIGLLDPYPYSASSALSAQNAVHQGFLFLNVSDRPCRIVRSGDGQKIAELRPHGAHLVFDLSHNAPAVEFVASAPFTFYLVMHGPDGGGFTLQHIKDPF